MKRKHKKDSVVSLETNCTTDDSEMIKRLKEDDEFIGELINSIPAKFYFDVELQSEIKENKHQTVREKIKEEEEAKPKVSWKAVREVLDMFISFAEQSTYTNAQLHIIKNEFLHGRAKASRQVDIWEMLKKFTEKKPIQTPSTIAPSTADVRDPSISPFPAPSVFGSSTPPVDEPATLPGIKRKVSIKKQHEIAKLDPCQQKTVTEIQGELKSEMKSPMKRSKFQSASMTRAANLEELQERLKKKIEALAASRKGKSSSLSSEGKQLKRKMEKSKRKRPSKKIKIITDQNAKIKATTAVGSNLETKTKPVYNKEGKMVYSKFNFADSKEKKKKKSEYSGKNYKKLLYKAEKDKEQMKALEETNPEKAMNVKEKKIWRKAIEKSEGMKVKDDPELLKKSIKKQKERKHRSQKKWKKRKELTEKQKEKRQQKRKRNIRARKQEKVKKKIKKAKKKGRILPGL